MKEVVTSFQLADSQYVNNSTLLNGRSGIVGNEVLSRFNLVIDYWYEKAYLRPNKSYKTAFQFDRSGILINASGKNLSQYVVQYITPSSPAAEAGVQKGDILLKINGASTKLMTMNSIYEKFKKRAGKKMNLVLLRNGVEQPITFYLRDLL
ncbi:MAG: PDZ domain-containing protein [Saprospiraceae bacterium]|nr:PDZ domain-containing protein [Saprospiraceae bacterium]